MEHRISVLLFLLILFLGPAYVLGSQHVQTDLLFAPEPSAHKFILTQTRLNEGLLVQIPHESKHLRLFDKIQNIRVVDPEQMQSQDQSIQHLNHALEEEQRHFRIKHAVSSQAFLDDIFSVSKEYNIDPLLLHAIAEIESRYNPIAISPAGAKGLMQVMPDTARRFGMKNPDTELFNPIHNLRISSNYIRSLHGLFGNNLPLILAAYNAGEHAVIKYGYAIPPYTETQQYVTKVMNRYLELKDQSMQF